MSETKGFIFLSYSRSNSAFALKLASDLKANGVNLWIDQLDIPAGSRWDRSVESALKKSTALLTVLSPAAVSSFNVMDEIAYALDENKKIIPILHEDCDIPFRLRRLQYINFTTDYNNAMIRLCESIGPDNMVKANSDNRPYSDAAVLSKKPIEMTKSASNGNHNGHPILKNKKEKTDHNDEIKKPIQNGTEGHKISKPFKKKNTLTRQSVKRIGLISFSTSLAFFAQGLIATGLYLILRDSERIFYDLSAPLLKGILVGMPLSFFVKNYYAELSKKHVWIFISVWVGCYYLMTLSYYILFSYSVRALLGYSLCGFLMAKIIQSQDSRLQIRNPDILIITLGWAIASQLTNLANLNLRLSDYISFDNMVFGLLGSIVMFFVLESSKKVLAAESIRPELPLDQLE